MPKTAVGGGGSCVDSESILVHLQRQPKPTRVTSSFHRNKQCIEPRSYLPSETPHSYPERTHRPPCPKLDTLRYWREQRQLRVLPRGWESSQLRRSQPASSPCSSSPGRSGERRQHDSGKKRRPLLCGRCRQPRAARRQAAAQTEQAAPSLSRLQHQLSSRDWCRQKKSLVPSPTRSHRCITAGSPLPQQGLHCCCQRSDQVLTHWHCCLHLHFPSDLPAAASDSGGGHELHTSDCGRAGACLPSCRLYCHVCAAALPGSVLAACTHRMLRIQSTIASY